MTAVVIKKRGWQRVLPIATWLPRYQRAWLPTDLVAGLAIWALTVPQALAYAGIAGVPPQYGLYAIPLAMLAYAIFGTSRLLSVGPDSATALISFTIVSRMVPTGLHERPVKALAKQSIRPGNQNNFALSVLVDARCERTRPCPITCETR